MKKITLIILVASALMLAAMLAVSELAAYFNHDRPLARPPEHGTAFIIEAGSPPNPGDTNALTNLKTVMGQRFRKFGLRVFGESLSGSRLRVVIPVMGTNEVEAARRLASHNGALELRLVHENNDQLVAAGDVPPGYELLKHQEKRPPSGIYIETLVVEKRPATGLAGDIVKEAQITQDDLGRTEIAFELNQESSAAFAKFTRSNVNRRLAIILDGELYSSPNIASPIENGMVMITGDFDRQEASLLTTLMRYPLPLPVTLVEAKAF
ncbi:MAG: hypothetical protein JF609_00840 [Verrucomicrobia bacterium]|nr:hypothetical protein [Verrucomicrobiota bacterium]